MHAGVRRLPRLIRAAPDTGTDAELLRRFAASRDEPAFAELVRRHGPLVLAVCRRVVSDSHLADDAFQATFIVLARKAASAGVGCRLSTWLHSVAVKVSLRARTMVGRRAKRETLTAAVPDVADKSSGGTGLRAGEDSTALLDQEIDRLPESLRVAVVLCELRGVSRRDAAKELGIAEGTLSSRLAAARKKLAERLRARGLAPAAAALFSPIFVPTDLAAAAIEASTGNVKLSTQITQLVDGGMKMALLTKLKLAAVAVAFAVLAAGGFGFGPFGNADAAPRPNAPLPKPAVGWKEATPITFEDGGRVTGVAYSPSGKALAVARDNGKIDFYDPVTRKHIRGTVVKNYPAHNANTEVGTVTAIDFCPRPHKKMGDLFAVTHKNGVDFGSMDTGLLADVHVETITDQPGQWAMKGFDSHQVAWLTDDALVATNGEEIAWRIKGEKDISWKLAGGKRGRPTLIAAIPGQSHLFLASGSTERETNEVHIVAAPPLSSPQTRLSGHKSRPTVAAVSKDGKRIVSADEGGTLIVWDTKQGLDFKEKSRVSVGPGLAQLALAPDGKTVAVLRVHGVDWLGGPANRSSEVFDLFVFDVTDPPAKPTPIWSNDTRSLPGKRNGPASLAFGPDGKTLLAAFADPFTADAKLYGPIPKSLGVRVWTLGEPDGRKKNAPVPKVKEPGRLWLHDAKANELVAYSPDLKELKRLKLPKGERFVGLTPDGAKIVFTADPQGPAKSDKGETYHLRPLDGDGKAVDLGLDASARGSQLYWNRSGTKVVRARVLDQPAVQATPLGFDLFDVNTRKVTPLEKGFDGHWLFGWADDEHLLSRVMVGDEMGTIYRTSLDGKQAVVLKDDNFTVVQLDVSRGGAVVVGGFRATPPKQPWHHALLAMDLKTGDLTELFHEEEQGGTYPVWSPDGGRIGFAWGYQKDGTDPNGWDELRLSTTDADGTNRKTVTLRDKAKGQDPYDLTFLGWFPDAKAAKPKPKLEGKIAVWQGDAVVVLSPDGTELSRHTQEELGGEMAGTFVRHSPDGSRLALAWCDAHNHNNGHAAILSADGKKVEHAKGFIGAPWAAYWLAEDDPQFGVNGSLKMHFMSAKSGEMVEAVGGGYNAVLAAAPNGVVVQQHDPVKKTLRIGHPEADDKDCYFVAEKDIDGTVVGVSRDGRTLLGVKAIKDRVWDITFTAVLLTDATTGKSEEVARYLGECQAALASNGEAVVFTARNKPKKPGEKPPFTLSVYDRATKETTVLVRDSKTSIRAVDWWTPAKADDRKKNAPVPAAKDAGLLWVKDEKANQLTAYTPALEVAKRVKLPAFGKFLGLTPDGANIVYAARAGARAGTWYFLRPLDEDAPATFLELEASIWDFPPIWSPDGKKFLRVRKDVDRKVPGFLGTIFRYDLFDLATKKATHLADVPYDHWIMDWAADGKKFITQSLRKGEEDTLHLMDPDGTSKPLPAEEKAIRPYKLARSPDGRTFLFSSYDSLWAIDAATGKRKELLDKTHGFPKPAWSPDGKRMAVAYCQFTKSKSPDPWDVQRLAVSDADGTNRKEITLRDKAKGEDAYDVDFLGWYPNKPAPAAVPPKKNAPVPGPPKEDTKGLTASVAFDQKEIMLGEPTYFTFTVNNPTDAGWQFEEGGDYRNRLGRPNSFAVAVTGPDGKAVPQPDSGFDMGGISVMVKLPADGKAAFHPLFLPHWATFEKPGEYTVTVKRKVGLVPADAEDGFRAKVTPVTLSATAKITVTATDAKRMGELIARLGNDMLDPKSADSDKSRKKMLAIRDPRVIPHFIELGKRPRVEARYAACEALGHFNTDEAFAELKKLYATTGADLKGSAINEQLENSSADGVRHAAIGAILECGHPDSLAFAWKTAIDDGYYGVRLTVLHKAYDVKSPEARKVIAKLLEDVHESVRGEARRYTDLLAKGDKK